MILMGTIVDDGVKSVLVVSRCRVDCLVLCIDANVCVLVLDVLPSVYMRHPAP